MIRVLIDEEYLKGYAVKLSALLWTGETDYSEQKKKAVTRVMNGITSKGYNVRDLMPMLTLRTAGNSVSATETTTGVEDTINRMTLVIDNITNTTSGKVLTFQGSDDDENYYDIDSMTILTSDTQRILEFLTPYKYYRLVTTIGTGSIDYRAYLVESVYSELFACMWLYFIYTDISKATDDQFDKKAKDFYSMYENIMNETKFYSDTDNDGEPDEVSVQNSITMLK